MKLMTIVMAALMSFSVWSAEHKGDVLVFAAHFESDSECAAAVSPFHWALKLEDLRNDAVIVRSEDANVCSDLKKHWDRYTRMLTTKDGLRFFKNNRMRGFVAGADYQTLSGINVLTAVYGESGLESVGGK